MQEFTTALAPGKWLVDLVPVLRYLPEWFPGAGFHKLAKTWRASLGHLLNDPFDLVKKEVAQGTAPPSFATTLLQQSESWTEEDETKWKYATSAIYAAGAEASSCALSTFFLAMTLFPDVQRKAQAELDSVIGRGSRLPELEDRANLPYLDALSKEMYRWNPTGSISIPHRLMQDDVYNGQFIPKGTTVLVNVWHILQDPSRYPDPSDFKPERFFPENSHGKINPDPHTVIFGSGRRGCPGQLFADASLFILLATTLALYDLAGPVGRDGEPIKVEPKFKPTMVSHPEPYECKITPRFPELKQMLS